MVLTYDDASAAPGKATADSDIVEARFVDIVPGARSLASKESRLAGCRGGQSIPSGG